MAFYGLLRGFWPDFRDLEACKPLERHGGSFAAGSGPEVPALRR